MPVEAVEAQEAQHVLADARPRIADEAHVSGAQIAEPGHRIEHIAVGVEEKGVHGEVAPRRVGRPVVGEGDARVAAEGLDVAAQGRDLEMPRRHHRRHRAVREPGGHGLDPRRREPAHDLLRRERRRDIDVADGTAQQRIAHAAANEARSAALGVERAQHGARRRFAHPGLRYHAFGRLLCRGHGARLPGSPGTTCPGTTRPSMYCGGT
jgi:hypothetical protein